MYSTTVLFPVSTLVTMRTSSPGLVDGWIW